MKKKVIVLSLGGSLIIPDNINLSFLNSFKKTIKKHTNKHKFIIVTGGGSTARKYINALEQSGKNQHLQSLIGISITRTNARFMSYFFGKNPEQGIPHTLNEVKKLINKQDIVFCGALEYKPKQTSDATSAEISSYFKSDFINLTNVSGLHDKNPLKYKNAKFIPKISSSAFLKMAEKIKFKPGQHFIIDQTAAKIIDKNKIKTYILGKNMKNLDNLLSKKKFYGSVIE